MDTSNKHLQRAVAALVVVIIALVMVIMRLAVGGHPAVQQTATAERPPAVATSARVVPPTPAPKPTPRLAPPVAPLPKYRPALVAVPKHQEAPKHQATFVAVPRVRPVLTDAPLPPVAVRLTASDMSAMSGPQMRLKRNEIYAEHGYRFHSSSLLAHFSAKPWYRPNTENMRVVEGRLSSVDAANLALLMASEAQYRRLTEALEASRKETPPRPAAAALLPLPPNVEAPTPPVQPPPSVEASVQVWVDTHSGIYHYPGRRWYGRTKQGQYMSEGAAQGAGYRASRNGQ